MYMNNTLKNTALGIQHVLAMYAGAVIVPLNCWWSDWS